MTSLFSEPTSQAPRKRRRPKGAKTADVRTQAIGVCHFAFLRAWISGVTLHKAWERYLAFDGGSNDERHIKAVRDRLYDQVVADGRAINERLPDDQKIDRFLLVMGDKPKPESLFVMPSMEEFCEQEGLDPDFYSEAELAEIMREHYPVDQPQEDEPLVLERKNPDVNAHVQALNVLQLHLAKPATEDDELGRWFTKALSKKLGTEAGAKTLGDLVRYINVHGHAWYRRISSLGPTRAKRIIDWLVSLDPDGEMPGLRLRDHAYGPITDAVASVGGQVATPTPSPRFGLVPIERIAVPDVLLGRDGYLRAAGPNTLGAETDAQAIQAWLACYEDRPKTLDTYKRDIERFWLWCLVQKRKPLSSITSMDCAEYKRFLEAPPADWIQERPEPRSSERWRPFRGKLSASSQKQALTIISICFESLVSDGYLIGNPMTGTLKKSKLKRAATKTDRGFTLPQWNWIWACTSQVRDVVRRERLRLTLKLLVTTGLRLDELTRARRGDLSHVQVEDDPMAPDTGEKAWILDVVGKGDVEREVPVPDDVVAMIDAHMRRYVALAGERWQDLDQAAVAALPLVAQVSHPVGSSLGGRVAITPLERSGVYRMLKRYFQFVAKQGVAAGRLDGPQFLKASTHWLRHTFGKLSVASGTPLDVVKEAMGHASLSTTSIYTTAGRSRMIKQLRTLPPGDLPTFTVSERQ